jgi:hypothetical protein
LTIPERLEKTMQTMKTQRKRKRNEVARAGNRRHIPAMKAGRETKNHKELVMYFIFYPYCVERGKYWRACSSKEARDWRTWGGRDVMLSDNAS